MAEQQRIIGGGLLLAGIAVVLILVFLFTLNTSMTPAEAQEQLLGRILPAYTEAQAKGEYLQVSRRAEEILETLQESGRTATVKLLQAEASSGDRDARRLSKMLEEGAFEKNVEGTFELDGDWYGETTHRPLLNLKRAIESELKVLRDVRDTANAAQKIVAEARVGSGMELALPPATVPTDDAPVVSPNPVYVSDAELYRVFGLKPEQMEKAVATAGEGSRAKSARLRWNKSEQDRSRTSTAMQGIPELAQQLERTGIEVQRNTRALRGNEEGAKKLASLLEKAATMLGSGLAGANKAAFEENREKFANGDAVSQALRQEASMLTSYGTTIRGLGKEIAKPFVD